MKNVIIVGNGPAGISAALYTVRAGISTTIIGNGLGSLEKADKIENYYGFPEPVSGIELVNNGIKQAERLGAVIVNEEVVGISFEENGDDSTKQDSFAVKTNKNQYSASAVILATGTSRTAPAIKGLKDLEGLGVSYCAVCDGFFYKGKDVAVLGNGDYALNEVKELLPVANSVTLLTHGSDTTVAFPKEVKVEKQSVASMNSGPANPLFGTAGPLESVTLKDNTQVKVQGVFIAYGTAGSSALAKKIGAFTNNNKISVDADMATNIPGLYAAGDCTGGLLQIAKAVSDGALAGNSVVKYLRK